MCSFFYQSMESVRGDLGDIVRGGGNIGGGRGFLLTPADDVPAVDPMGDDEFQELSTKMTASPLHLRPIKPAPLGDHPPVSAPSRAPGVKRRKGQAKRVICIPAPASDQERNNKSGGVVVPSDLWAWRKYGQKPIKGSPHPRGYYRCSSSKGCSARKQVERSRSDPKMLVITYNSEHNHPWPTHRSSLAGSTRRSQPPKSSHSTSNAMEPLIKDESPDVGRPAYEPLTVEISKDMGIFDELGGLEPDPMGFFFSPRDQLGLEEADIDMDPLSCFDWD